MRKPLPVLVGLIFLACGRAGPDDSALAGGSPPAAALAPYGNSLALDQALALIEQELVPAIRGDNIREHVERAEAVTDRLVETQLPFAWITSRSYGVEPMLRQIQVLADRVVAQQRNGVHQDALRRDMEDLLELVRGLRTGIREGGGPHPPSLDSLLARYAADTLARNGPGGGE